MALIGYSFFVILLLTLLSDDVGAQLSEEAIIALKHAVIRGGKFVGPSTDVMGMDRQSWKKGSHMKLRMTVRLYYNRRKILKAGAEHIKKQSVYPPEIITDSDDVWGTLNQLWMKTRDVGWNRVMEVEKYDIDLDDLRKGSIYTVFDWDGLRLKAESTVMKPELPNVLVGAVVLRCSWGVWNVKQVGANEFDRSDFLLSSLFIKGSIYQEAVKERKDVKGGNCKAYLFSITQKINKAYLLSITQKINNNENYRYGALLTVLMDYSNCVIGSLKAADKAFEVEDKDADVHARKNNIFKSPRRLSYYPDNEASDEYETSDETSDEYDTSDETSDEYEASDKDKDADVHVPRTKRNESKKSIFHYPPVYKSKEKTKSKKRSTY